MSKEAQAATGECDNFVTLFSKVDSATLGEDDLFDIIEALTPVASEWMDIGIALQIKASKLREIESNNKKGVKGCLRDMITEFVNMNYDVKKHGEPTWQKIVRAVEHQAGGNNRAHAIVIAKEHISQSDNPDPQSASQDKDTTDGPSHLLEALAQKLRVQTEAFHSLPVDSEDDKQLLLRNIKKALTSFIETAVKSGVSSDRIRKVLAGLYSKDLLVDNTVYDWALGEIEKFGEQSELGQQPTHDQKAKEKLPPLFCEDTVYHACLCSLAASTCTAADYKDLFNKKFPEHSLEEASLSRSQDREDVDRYLIARQGKVYYVAFRSEPLLSDWMEKFSSFEEGIKVQSERIPLRFFIRQMHDGCRVVFTGFSFGGLLAKAVTARLWLEPLLSVDLLMDSITCITLGAPMVTISSVATVMRETPQFGSTVHSIVLDSDPIPRLSMFLDPRCEEVGSEVLLPTVLKSIQSFQGFFTSALTCYMGIIQKNSLSQDTDLDVPNAFSSMKSLLQKAAPQLFARLPKVFATEDVLFLMINPSKGLTCKHLNNEELVSHFEFVSLPTLDQLSFEMFSQHNVDVYQRAVFKGYIKQTPPPGVPIKDINGIKPSILSVDFRRYGREVSVTMNGDSLWFCYHIQVAQYKTKVKASETSQHSLQFNYDPENDTRIPTDADNVRVVLTNHFYNPVKDSHVQVSRKVFQFTCRQEQLAKLTPSELIETAYLSALLEHHPHLSHSRLSHRFNIIRDFLEQIVSVVPIESIIDTIASCENQKIANMCADLVGASQIELPPSLMLLNGFRRAVSAQLQCSSQKRTSEEDYYRNAYSLIFGREVTKKDAHEHYRQSMFNRLHIDSPIHEIINKEKFFSRKIFDDGDHAFAIETLKAKYSSHPRFLQISQLMKMHYQTECMLKSSPNKINAINGFKLNLIYPLTFGESSTKTPLETLVTGRKQLLGLSQQSFKCKSDNQSTEGLLRLSQLYNSKMLEIVNHIRSNDLKMCTHLLGAFMEEQIKVPLVKSEFDTAKALGGLLNAAAVGVWAMFSLSLGDMNAVIQSIPTGSLLVQVTDYIKGIFKEKTISTDRHYAGKLQFMVQGMDKTVSCNTHYISYSLERQLIELCKKLNISESTPLEVLVRDWDKLFKEDVLSLVVPTHRSLIASWMKWALMVHNLREEMAKYTTVGVVGLVNSGKSLLVSTLFNIEVPVGTTAVKRTTIPFLYNMEGVIDGMDVIDFPGVDDRDDTIPDLCELLLALAQVVIFVVDYRKAHTQSAKKWLEMLEDKSVPVLVCLTYADKLYAEHMGRDGSHPEASHIQQRVTEEVSMIKEQLGHVPSHEVQLFSFSQDRDSVLNSDEGREKLKVAGIAPPQAVGDWLAGVFESQLDQDEVATQLREYVKSR